MNKPRARLSLTAFEIKALAAAAMLFDHLQVAFPDTFPLWFRVVGRLAFPLFAYLLADGFRHTRAPWKFAARLAVFAVVSEPFFDLAVGNAPAWYAVDFFNNTNIFYTFFLGGGAIALGKYARDKWNAAWVAPMAAVLLGLAGSWLGVDYGWVGVVFIFALYHVKKTRRLMVLALLCFAVQLPLFVFLAEGHRFEAPGINYALVAATFLTVPVAALYNGKRGPDEPAFKWFFYTFYPAHLAVLAAFILT